MSRIFEALRQSELEAQEELGGTVEPLPAPPAFHPNVPLPAAPGTTPQPGTQARSSAPTPRMPATPAETLPQAPPEVPAARAAATAAPTDLPSPAPTPAASEAAVARSSAANITFDINTLNPVALQLDSCGHLVSMTDERGLGAEKFRVLATRLANIRQSSPLKVVQVTSSIVGEGKTVVACNLAATLAKRSGQSVLLIEGDLRKPAVCPMFGLPLLEGIGELWRQKEKSPSEFMRRIADTSLCLLPAGNVAHPVAVLQSGRMADLIEQVAGWFDWVVVDTPPMLPMADSNLWARLADGTLLVVREGVVRRRALQAAVDSMDSPKLIGVVLNDAIDFDRMEYYGRYYMTENSADTGSKRKRKTRQ